MNEDFSDWKPRPLPERIPMEGRFCRLEPLSASRHGDGLFAASSQEDAADRHRWLYEEPPESREAFQHWLETVETSADPMFFVVVDKRTGAVEGRQTLMRIDAANGVIETGNIMWNAYISRTPVTTEALFLFAKYVFDDLGYRRFEWKCNNKNEPSKRAALRFGYAHEGVFRQHLIVKGRNRDTAWFAMIDHEWPDLRTAFECWLDPSNFDSEGRQIKRLEEFRNG